MVDPVSRRQWAFRALFVALAAAVVFLQILPFRIDGDHWPGPDILTLLAFAWVMRRPDYVPPVLVLAVMLFTDVLFMRPLGLWAAIVLIGLEFLRARQQFSRDLPFLVEWIMVAIVIAMMTLTNTLVLAIFLVEQPVLTLITLQMIISILSYPVVVAVSRYVIGVRKMAPAEAGALGYRI
ncbi:rod shape-determining protein MreD [Oceaniglobus ichthyenteri]|uniref:rod shape-determining protein MreD n=1 Tax=Oceaniglobus ichthyenteri TaxID=2136177 RepID=UPI000D37670A|nr:rod shape-determining protein MreD [Oceaniglobus ichthyenteri]